MKSDSVWPAHVGFGLATLMVFAMAWSLYESIGTQVATSRSVAHTQAGLRAIAEVEASLARAESAQRAYLLVPQERFLAERDKALGALNEATARVKLSTSGNPVQQGRIPDLEALIAARVAIMREREGRRPTGGIGSVQFGPTELAHDASTGIYTLTEAMKQEEQRILELRRAEEEQQQDRELVIFAVLIASGVLLLIPGYIGFVLQARARRLLDRKLRMMADSLPGAMYQLRHHSKADPSFTFMSAGIAKVRGLSASTRPAWTTLVAGIDERDRPRFVSAFEEAKKKVGTFRAEYRVKHGDGTEKWLQHDAVLQTEEDGSLIQNGYVSDITEQARLKAALTDAKESADLANRAKSTFLATMSHEIRTPMNGVLGLLELLSLTRLEGEQRTTLETVRESSKSLLRIIDDILDFSKIEAGKLEVRPDVTSIRGVIADVHRIFAGNASSKGLLIKCSVDPRISPAVLVDSLRLRQILNNFVSNAIKFTTRGTIDIRAELVERVDNEERVRFSIQDTGIGISAENQARLFQAFTQVEGNASQRSGGTGLGLTICRRLAGLMAGMVEMASEPGNGTTMTLTLLLPVADPKDLPEEESETTREAFLTTARMRRMAPSVLKAEAEGTLILLVDDHPTNRALLIRQVHALGYAAESAGDGLEALEQWKSGRFGVVITDCNMPEMDGYALASSIRRLESDNGKRRVPIIACTANALAGEAEICFAAGMDDYLAKPVDLKALLKKLDQWLPIPQHTARHTTPSSIPIPAAQPVDGSVLAVVSGGDLSTEREILKHFQRVNDVDAAMLNSAVSKIDLPQVTHASHRIRGAANMVGALGLAGVCEIIEFAGRSRDLTTVQVNMRAFKTESDRVNAYIDSF